MKISVVIPVYGCPDAIKPLCERLTTTLRKLTELYEIILINDSCPKDSWKNIKTECNKDSHIVGIDLSRNFGQQNAIMAGLDYSTGDYVVVMDCDLQDCPEDISQLYNAITTNDVDVVFAKNKQNKKKKITSKIFYKLYAKLMGVKYDSGLSNFGIYKRTVINGLTSMRESNRGFTSYIKWMGFKQLEIEVTRSDRYEGKSGYSFKKRLKMAMDIFYSQTNFPISITRKAGIFSTIFSLLGLTISLISCILLKSYLTMIILTISFCSLFVLGILLYSLSILGNYIVRTYNEAKNRPLYFIREIINNKKDI